MLCLALSAVPALAVDYEKPTGKILFTIHGLIDPSIAGKRAEIGRDTLEKIGFKSLTTRTFYSKKRYQFSGVLMRDLLDHVGAKGKILEITALDDYRITVPIEDYYKYDVLLATMEEGKTLTIRKRGPARIIYPIEKHEELSDKKYASRYIWQIKSMNVK
jgi:hypothetical protein